MKKFNIQTKSLKEPSVFLYSSSCPSDNLSFWIVKRHVCIVYCWNWSYSLNKNRPRWLHLIADMRNIPRWCGWACIFWSQLGDEINQWSPLISFGCNFWNRLSIRTLMFLKSFSQSSFFSIFRSTSWRCLDWPMKSSR